VKATIQARNAHGNYSARTDNNILLVFTVDGAESFELGESIEVDLPSILSSQQVLRSRDRRGIRIRIMENDIHDLDLSAKHGVSRIPSADRMRRT
jgi:hypothetical protein